MNFKQTIMIPALTASTCFCLISCGEKKEQAHAETTPTPEEKQIPKTQGEEMLYLLKSIQNQQTADEATDSVTKTASGLADHVTNDEAVGIINEMMRLNSCNYFGSESLKAAVDLIKFNTSEYSEHAPLDVDGYEPTPDPSEK